MHEHANRTTTSRVIIFDWDDTLCPSSYFDREQIDTASFDASAQQLLDEIAVCAENCLKQASAYGDVLIITNSDEGWVQYSCERLLPRLLPALQHYKVVSARTTYETFYPGQPLCWKAAAFAHQVNASFQTHPAATNSGSTATTTVDAEMLSASQQSFPSLDDSDVSSEEEEESSLSLQEQSPNTLQQHSHSRHRREIISFGDSMEERTATRIVSQQLDAVSKTVLFLGSPTPTQIIGQLHWMTRTMQRVCTAQVSAIDTELTKEQAASSALAYAKARQQQPLLMAAAADRGRGGGGTAATSATIAETAAV